MVASMNEERMAGKLLRNMRQSDICWRVLLLSCCYSYYSPRTIGLVKRGLLREGSENNSSMLLALMIFDIVMNSTSVGICFFVVSLPYWR